MLKKGMRVLVKAKCWTEFSTPSITILNDDGENVNIDFDPEVEIVHEPKQIARHKSKKMYRARQDKETHGVLVGKTRRQTGYYSEGTHGDWDNYDPPSLIVDKTHAVWLIEPEPDSVWYREPFTALECDLEVAE